MGDMCMKKYNYYNMIINKKNRKRYYFFREFSKILTMYKSTSEEVNELIEWLFALSNGLSEIESYHKNINYDYDLKLDEKIDKNTFRRNVWMQDLRLYSLVAAVHETSSFETKDTLSDIVFEIYQRLNEIIYANPRQGLDYDKVRFYSEVEYINKKDKKNKNLNMI